MEIRNEPIERSEQAFEGPGLAFYRCALCAAVVSQWDIQEAHGCAKCGNNRIQVTNLTLWEKLVQIMKHPAVWRWSDELQP